MYSYKNKPQPPTPGWMKAGLILFLLYAVFVGYDRNKNPEENPDLAIKNYPAVRDFVSLQRWNQLLDPAFGKEIAYNDLVIGEKDIAACGQQVTVAIEALEQEGVSLPDNFVVPDEPLNFRIGDGTQPYIWDRAVRGMREKGERQIVAGLKLIDPDREELDAPSPQFKLSMQAIEPNTAGKSVEMERLRDGVGVPISCGDMIQLTFRILNEAGEQRFILRNPETIRVGDGAFGHGIDRGLIGLRPNGMRGLIIPPDYFPTGREAIPFPDGENAIVEIIPLPYNEESIGDETNEPDSQ